MGDVLVTSSLFPILREKYPHAQLHYLIAKNNAQILENNPNIDNLVYYEDGFWKNLSNIKKGKYDIIIDVYSKIGTALMSFLSGAKKTTGYYKTYLSPFYTDPVKRKLQPISTETALALEHRLQLLEPLGISYKKVKPELFVTFDEKNYVENKLKNYGVDFTKKLVMISTFGSSVEKSYPYMKEVLEQIAETHEIQILCNYLPFQKEKFNDLFESLNHSTQQKIIKNFDTTNLREYIATVSFCSALIGNEGGSTNIAKALDVPTFGIFAPFVDKLTWSWAEDGCRFDSVHIHDFNKESLQYEDLKPELFKQQLQEFLNNNLV